MKRDGPFESFVTAMLGAVDLFASKESGAKDILNKIASSDPAIFFAAAIHVVAVTKPSAGRSYLVLTLARDKRFCTALLNSKLFTANEALVAVRAASEGGAELGVAFEKALGKALEGEANTQKTETIVRILDILTVTRGQTFGKPVQIELMAHPDKIVRSKAAIVIGRITRSVDLIASFLLDPDSRVQANAVEALWRLNADEVKPHFLSALKSSNNRVAANAAVGLYLSGDATAIPALIEMLHHADPLFRLSALWAIGETQDKQFLPVLSEQYKQSEGKLRLAAVRAIARIRRNTEPARD